MEKIIDLLCNLLAVAEAPQKGHAASFFHRYIGEFIQYTCISLDRPPK
jgi:hypothetical protein